MKKYLIIVLLPLLFFGCSGFEEIELVEVKDVTYREFTGNVLQLTVTVTVNNPNRCKVTIKDAHLNLRLNDRVIGSVVQITPVELNKRSQKDYQIPISVEIKDLLSGLAGLFRVLMNESQKLNFSGTVHVKSMVFSKTIAVDRLSFQ